MNRRERRILREKELTAAEKPAALVAAAVNVKASGGFTGIRLGATEWQQEAWNFYDTCPEFHAAVNIIAYNLSRARLIGVDVDPATGEPQTQPTEDPEVVQIMAQFLGGPTGQSQALDRLGRHLTVAGDSWALATPTPDVDGAVWEILASTDVTGAAGRIMVRQLNGQPREVDTDTELLMRIWRPHPKIRWEPDSMTRSLLPVLRELAALTAMVTATVKSRLASAGILWIPDDITLPKPVTSTGEDSQAKSESAGADGWLDLITEAMTAPIRDPDSASAVVPLIAVVKKDSIKEITHMEFGRDLDATIEPLRQACVRRLAVGADMPPEMLTGMGSTNHWTSWAISEEFAKAFLSPLLELIVDSATQYYLRPALRAYGKDPARFAVWFDLAALFPRQISVDNATEAHKAGLLSDRKFMEVLGFSEADMADDRERARHLVEELLMRGNPQTLAEVADSVGLLFPGLVVHPIAPTNGAPNGARPALKPPPPTEPVPPQERRTPPVTPGREPVRQAAP